MSNSARDGAPDDSGKRPTDMNLARSRPRRTSCSHVSLAVGAEPSGDHDRAAKMTQPESKPPERKTEEVVLLEDLAPRQDVTGGRKITLGESITAEEEGPEHRPR